MHNADRLLGITSFILFFSAAGCTEMPKTLPPPITIAQSGVQSEVILCGIKVKTKVETPDASLPPHLRALVGIWGNTAWEATPNAPSWNKSCTALIVENVTHDGKLQVVYIVGDTPYWQVKGGWKRHTTLLKNGEFVIYVNNGKSPALYSLAEDGSYAYITTEAGWALRAYPQKLPIQVTKAP